MEYRVRELLEKFLKAYMSERDLKKRWNLYPMRSSVLVPEYRKQQGANMSWNSFCKRNFLLIRRLFFIP